MDDRDVLDRINRLIDEERRLREERAAGKAAADAGKTLDDLEVMLDQCWDLLRQRRALREFGEDADLGGARPASVVENYQQ